jgi:uncharacterized protein
MQWSPSFATTRLLHHAGQHQWYTVKGGSQQYVSKLRPRCGRVASTSGHGRPVAHVRRDPAGVEVRATGGRAERFDEVIFATHSDDTLRLLADPSPDEARMLGAVQYQPNDVILHSDTSSCRGGGRSGPAGSMSRPARPAPVDRIELTYWMNSLQPWLTRDPFFVTLNTDRPIREDLIWDKVTFRHPVYDLAARRAAAAGGGDERNEPAPGSAGHGCATGSTRTGSPPGSRCTRDPCTGLAGGCGRVGMAACQDKGRSYRRPDLPRPPRRDGQRFPLFGSTMC